MPKQQEPKKPRRPKSKRLNLNRKDQWEKLLKEVNKEQVPIGVLRYITVNLKDGTSVDVNISDMIEEGADPAFVEQLINSKLEDSLISCSYQQLQLAQKISTNIRIFESSAYQIALLISGKSEIALLPNKPITYGLDLLVREAGGLSYVKNNVFIASNYQIQEKLQKVLF